MPQKFYLDEISSHARVTFGEPESALRITHAHVNFTPTRRQPTHYTRVCTIIEILRYWNL